jgi:hypothetical protein
MRWQILAVSYIAWLFWMFVLCLLAALTLNRAFDQKITPAVISVCSGIFVAILAFVFCLMRLYVQRYYYNRPVRGFLFPSEFAEQRLQEQRLQEHRLQEQREQEHSEQRHREWVRRERARREWTHREQAHGRFSVLSDAPSVALPGIGSKVSLMPEFKPSFKEFGKSFGFGVYSDAIERSLGSPNPFWCHAERIIWCEHAEHLFSLVPGTLRDAVEQWMLLVHCQQKRYDLPRNVDLDVVTQLPIPRRRVRMPENE